MKQNNYIFKSRSNLICTNCYIEYNIMYTIKTNIVFNNNSRQASQKCIAIV